MKKDCEVKDIGIWIRVSTDYQKRKDSPKTHRKRAEAYAKLKGWTVKEIYNLVYSGKSVKDHPETKRMLGDIRNGNIQALVFSNLSRLARNVKELIEIADVFRTADAGLVSIKESIDTSTSAGKLLFHVLASLAEFERDEISERVQASVITRSQLGKSLGGQAPFGYRWVEKEKLVIDDTEAEIVKTIFKTFLQCKKIRTTARAINEKGYRTRRGCKWGTTTIRRMLGCQTYKGKHILNHTKSRGDGKSWDEKPKDDWVILDVDKIISKKMWDEVNTILKSLNSEFKKCGRPARRYLLSGLIRCGKCGKKVYGKTYPWWGSVYLCDVCRIKMKVEKMDDMILAELENYKFNPKDCVFDLKVSKSIGELERNTGILKSELSRIESQIDNLLEARRLGEISNQTFKNRIEGLEKRKEDMSSNLGKLEGELAYLRVTQASQTYVDDKAKTFLSMFPYMSFSEKRSMLEEIIESIVLDEKEIKISLYFLPFFQKEISSLTKVSQTHRGSLLIFHNAKLVIRIPFEKAIILRNR